ncbi:unnamed protein product [Prorocentrum cordatum]|uniref:ADP-ribosyl cyclase/cyclic ADP-ribose hydrolase n=1 Tax=Prorocentrum cordatum TaxID=2364126 RepID=A0ABN9TRG4_9DINO|nr:unnamed protein product [Polarella glacialis]
MRPVFPAALLLSWAAGAELQLMQMTARSPVKNSSDWQPSRPCRTPVEGDECHSTVMWAMQTGIVKNPDWYVPLTRNSSFEDFQRLTPRRSDVCPEPCAAQAGGLPPPAGLPAPDECHTSVRGDACYGKVMWAMQTGIVERPDWYPGLTRNSSFEDFQRFLHSEARLSRVCPRPCEQEECRTPAEGDACYKVLVWSMQTGVVENPDWFAPLTKNSSFEDFQRHTARVSDVCPSPACAPSPAQRRRRRSAARPSEATRATRRWCGRCGWASWMRRGGMLP